MPSIRYLQFGGLRPAVSDKLLPAPYASVAQNAALRNGELCPFLAPCAVAPCTEAHIAYVPDTGAVLCAPGCIVPHYDAMCSGDRPIAVFQSGQPARRYDNAGALHPLVPPYPTTAPVVVQLTPGSVTSENGPETRAYTYTWVDRFGHESPPAPATVVPTAAYNATYQLTLAVPPATAVCVRIYRMTNAQENTYGETPTATSFQLVREVDPTAVFVDGVLQRDMDMGELLTTDNCPPPDMDCVMELESGYLVGWKGHMVFFSERGEPHNWPDRYRYTLSHAVVGGAVNGDSVYLGTTGTPYRIDTAPPAGEAAAASMQVHRYLKSRTPLRHRNAITCTDSGAAMSTRHGVLHMDRSPVARLASRGRIDEAVWEAQYDPRILVWSSGRLYGAGGPVGGFVMGWQGGDDALDLGDLVTITWNPTTAHAGDDGRLYYAEAGQIWIWNCGPAPMTYVWKGPVVRTPGLMHWAAVKVVGDFSGGRTATVTISNKEGGVYDVTTVTEDCTIYRVPCHPEGTQWNLEVTGTACICELHLATAKAELTEQGGGGRSDG